MTVKFGLRGVLERKRMSQSEASRVTGVSFATINRLCQQTTTRVDLAVIDKLCRELQVKPGDLLVYTEAISRRRG